MSEPIDSSGTPVEIAPGVFWLAVGRGPVRANVYFVRSGPTWTLIDTGPAGYSGRILEAAARLFGPDSHPSSILLTHHHLDHTGSARALAEGWGCPVLTHPAELPLVAGHPAAFRHYPSPVSRWLTLPLLVVTGAVRRGSRSPGTGLGGTARSFDPHEGVPGLPAWRAVPTPGHTGGHVAFFRPSDRVLISGDTLVTVDVNTLEGLYRGRQGLAGPPRIATWSLRVTKDSINSLVALKPRVVAPGHGVPLTGVETADEVQAFAERFAEDLNEGFPEGWGA